MNKNLSMTFSIHSPIPAVTIVVLLLALLGSFSCRSSFAPPVNGTPVIHYRTTGGFGGENSPIITIYSDRIAVRHGYPDLGMKLSEGHFSHLIKMFDGFDSLAGPYESGWMDDITHNLEFTKVHILKRVSFEEGIRESNASIGLRQLFRIVDTLRQLSDSICRAELPWRDVTVSFSTDKLVYGPGQPVRLIYTISNPTNDERTVLFRHGPPYSFSVGKNNMNYEYPDPRLPYDDEPSEIKLDEHEQKQLIHSIDLQEVFDMPPQPGVYSAFMRLGGGGCSINYETRERVYFELADSSMPIGGKAEVDTTDSNRATQGFSVHTACAELDDGANSALVSAESANGHRVLRSE
ncbi:MAG: hypothetical protein ACKVRP_13110 [Bacteroidota bacterium]